MGASHPLGTIMATGRSRPISSVVGDRQVLLRVRRRKVRLEGWVESLRFEVKPFGTIAEPFRTDLLSKESTA